MEYDKKRELHDKLFELRLKQQHAKIGREDTSLIEKEIKEVRQQIASEARKSLDEQNKKGR